MARLIEEEIWRLEKTKKQRIFGNLGQSGNEDENRVLVNQKFEEVWEM